MADSVETMIPGIELAIDERAVCVSSAKPLLVLSSAVVGGGLGRVRHIVNMHVRADYDCPRPEDDLAAFALSCRVDEPFVGLMTAAHTEYACQATATDAGLTVVAVVSVGLSNTTCAGILSPLPVPGQAGAVSHPDLAAQTPTGLPASAAGQAGAVSHPDLAAAGTLPPASPGTINAILLIDAALTPAALVNAVITASEAKTLMLGEWNVRTANGLPASGTSTDSVVVACTGRGEEQRYAGPATTVGWLVARTMRQTITQICREKLARDDGQRIGW
ncbi:MAG: adenosylcobinamide amidohydrolase [Thermoleophilia bacterium]